MDHPSMKTMSGTSDTQSCLYGEGYSLETGAVAVGDNASHLYDCLPKPVPDPSFLDQSDHLRVLGPDSPSSFCFLSILNAVLQSNFRAHVGLAAFTRLSCSCIPRIAHGQGKPSSDLWPCPPPVWRWTGPSNLSPRRRRRKKFLRLRNQLVQQLVAVLNWEALGHPIKPPPQATVGYGYSESQIQMIQRLEDLVTHFALAGRFDAQTLGRSAEKLDKLLSACQELPVSQVQDVDLDELLSVISRDLDPYSTSSHDSFSPNDSKDTPVLEPQSSESEPRPFENLNVDMSTVCAKPVFADRIKWEHSPTFDPTPFLADPVVREAFCRPNSLRMPRELWKRAPAGRVHCSKQEVLKLAHKWDAKGACQIFPCHTVLHEEAVGIFAVPKDQNFDRLILNPVVVNARMQHYSNYTKSLAPGALIAMIQLSADEILRVSADDLSEMYYTFKVPSERARRNCIRLKFAAHELSSLSCFNPDIHKGPCYVALSALAMGDSLAVEIAQQAHFQVLSQVAGCMREHERVAYRRSFPRGPFFEFLAIDDHLGLQIVSRAAYKARHPARDTQVFAASEEAYRQVGLVQHPRKRQREVVAGTFLGAELDGVVGKVSSPRHRIGLLMLCTSILARKGTATPKLLSSILGSWISVLMFRRPIMCVISELFKEGQNLPANRVFSLSRQSRNELLALATLGPLCQADLRTTTTPKVFCMDASPYGGAVCVADEPSHVVSELWRQSEQRGFYTRLDNPAAATLRELGIEPEPAFGASQSDPIGFLHVSPCKHLREGFIWDCIELFRGEGNWSSAHSEAGLVVHGGLEIKGGLVAYGDLLDNSVFHQLRSLALRGVIRDWHAGPPCFTFGTLRRPRIRSKLKPAGFDLSDPLTREQNSLARRTAYLLSWAMSRGSLVSCEQPGSSVMFRMEAFKSLARFGCVLSKFCFCSFGSAFKKPSKWLHNKPWLLEMECGCNCRPQQHLVIQGTFTKALISEFDQKCKPNATFVYGRLPTIGEAVSSFSASYPKPFCRRLAVGSLAFKEGSTVAIPLGKRIATLSELGCDPPDVSGAISDAPGPCSRPWFEDADWVGELSDSLHFRELVRYKFAKSGHINVLECRVYKTWIKYCAKHFPCSRVLGLLDSRVTLGATAKGRSSSPCLSHVLQGSLGYILGGCLYPGGLHICSKKNRSDGPSRNRPVEAPSKLVPPWLVSLRAGETDLFDVILNSSAYGRAASRWLKLLLLRGGDIERNPGPEKHHLPRGPIDLTVGFAPATSKRMQDCLQAFKLWASTYLPCNFTDLTSHPHAMALGLRAYGLHLYETGLPRYLLVYAITSVQDLYPHFRSHMSPAWHVDRKWQLQEPGECRPVISAPVLRAMSSIALFWGWARWLAITLLGFIGMMHPAEFLNLVRRDLVFPSDAMLNQEVMYIHLRNPKTSRFARRQHCRIDEALVITFAFKVFGDLSLDEKLYPGSASTYRRQWDAILSRLEVPHSKLQKGATPGVLRGSGATHLYLATEDVQKVAWRGRWTKLKTVEYYLQEVAAQLLLHRLSPVARDRIRIFSDFSALLLQLYVKSPQAFQEN